MKAIGVMNDDEPIDSPAYNVAVVATQMLTVAEALALQYGAEVARNGLLVACVVFAERTLGREGMAAELHEKVARLLENPTIEAAVHKWLH
jgi:hypothetical protein